MIAELVVWYGGQVATYDKELDQWLHSENDLDANYYQATDIDPLALGDDVHESMVDTGGLMSDKSIVLYNPGAWTAPQAKAFVKCISEMSVDVRISMVYGRDNPPKCVLDAMTEEMDRGIPFQEPEEMAGWIKDWLFSNNVIVSDEDALHVANHCGHDVPKMVQGLLPVANGFEGRVSKDVIMKNMGDLGLVSVFDLTTAILSGDRAKAYENVRRAAGTSPFALLTILGNKMRALAAITFDQHVDLESFKIYGGAQYYVKRDAKNLTKSQALLIISVLGKYDNALKGGSPLNSQTQIEIMVDTLTMICAGDAAKSSAVTDADLLATC